MWWVGSRISGHGADWWSHYLQKFSSSGNAFTIYITVCLLACTLMCIQQYFSFRLGQAPATVFEVSWDTCKCKISPSYPLSYPHHLQPTCSDGKYAVPEAQEHSISVLSQLLFALLAFICHMRAVQPHKHRFGTEPVATWMELHSPSTQTKALHNTLHKVKVHICWMCLHDLSIRFSSILPYR